MIQIHWLTFIYLTISLLFFIWFLKDFFNEYYGNFSSKHKYSIGTEGTLSIILWLLCTLIYGGIFWW